MIVRKKIYSETYDAGFFYEVSRQTEKHYYSEYEDVYGELQEVKLKKTECDIMVEPIYILFAGEYEDLEKFEYFTNEEEAIKEMEILNKNGGNKMLGEYKIYPLYKKIKAD